MIFYLKKSNYIKQNTWKMDYNESNKCVSQYSQCAPSLLEEMANMNVVQLYNEEDDISISSVPSLISESDEEDEDDEDKKVQLYDVRVSTPVGYKRVIHRSRTEFVPLDYPVAYTPGYGLGGDIGPYQPFDTSSIGPLVYIPPSGVEDVD